MKALGMIEVYSFTTAVCVGDVAAKAADVKVIAFDRTRPKSEAVPAPLVMAFMLALPLIIPVLYTNQFMPMASICVMAGLFQLHRSVTLPLEYVSLAHGHSWMFLLLESIYNIMVVVFVYFHMFKI